MIEMTSVLEITTKDGVELVEATGGWTRYPDGRLVVDGKNRKPIREYGRDEWSYRQLNKQELHAIQLKNKNDTLTAENQELRERVQELIRQQRQINQAFDKAELETAEQYNNGTCAMRDKDGHDSCPICYFRRRVKIHLGLPLEPVEQEGDKTWQ